MAENLWSALIAFQKECPAIPYDSSVDYKDKTGRRINFKFASLGGITNVIRPIMARHDLGLVQPIVNGEVITRVFYHTGESLESSYPIPPCNNPQDLGKWITYLKRYMICSILGIVGEEDDDGQIKEFPRIEAKEPRHRKQAFDIDDPDTWELIDQINFMRKHLEKCDKVEDITMLKETYPSLMRIQEIKEMAISRYENLKPTTATEKPEKLNGAKSSDDLNLPINPRATELMNKKKMTHENAV